MNTPTFFRFTLCVIILVALTGHVSLWAKKPSSAGERVIVTTGAAIDAGVRAHLTQYANKFHHVFPQVRQIAMTIPAGNRERLAADPLVASVVEDLPVELHANLGIQNLDLVDVVEAGTTLRNTNLDGSGVFAVYIDTGILPDFRRFFSGPINLDLSAGLVPQGGNNQVDQPDILRPGAEFSQNSHGSIHIAILHGYEGAEIDIGSRAETAGLPSKVEGLAPGAEVVAVRVFANDTGAFFSDIFAGLFHAVNIRTATGRPVVANLSLGSAPIDPILFDSDGIDNGFDDPIFTPFRAPFQFAIDQGVIVVTSGGNSGVDGMGIPGAFPEVISVAATGANFHDFPLFSDDPRPALFGINNLETQFTDVPEGASNAEEVADNVYVFNFSSRELPGLPNPRFVGQELDIAAPGGFVVAPYLSSLSGTGISRPPGPNQDPNTHQGFSFTFGTSFSAPHVTAAITLMLQKDPTLTQAEVESILKSTAIPIPAPASDDPDSDVRVLFGEAQSWGTDATGAGFLNVLEALDAL